ncbi:vWA domain-containing protein [Vibrio sp. WXL103]|uniref:vWA domain-containing protein n=1 Tax=unclassified Vibrio TaxID=2614977 RepID=UPI003EC54C85
MNFKTRFRSLKKAKGLVAVLGVIAAPFLVLVVGFTIDTGRAFLVQAKLFTAVDAAAIAAARSVSEGESAARVSANKLFAANLPQDYHGASTTTPNLAFAYDESGNISIDVNASVDMDTMFLGMIGVSTLPVAAEAQTIRRPVDLVLVVDNTTSLRYGSVGDVTQDVITRSKEFIGNFNENFDRVALVKFAFGAEVPVSFSSTRGHSRSSLNSAIDGFQFGSRSDPQFTNSSEGIYRALDALRNINDPASLKVIVFFTDGAPNTFSSNFDFTRTRTNYTGSIISGDSSSGTPWGLWNHRSVNSDLSGTADQGSNISSRLASLPTYYNAHDSDDNEFRVLNPDHSNRPVTQYRRRSHDASDLYDRVNRVSRNLVEDMAEAARQEGIYVFTLGLGSSLTGTAGPDNEIGEDLLLRMANDPRILDDPNLASDYRASQLEGVYCHAIDERAIGPCFDKMLDVIIRLTL